MNEISSDILPLIERCPREANARTNSPHRTDSCRTNERTRRDFLPFRFSLEDNVVGKCRSMACEGERDGDRSKTIGALWTRFSLDKDSVLIDLIERDDDECLALTEERTKTLLLLLLFDAASSNSVWCCSKNLINNRFVENLRQGKYLLEHKCIG